MATGLLSSTAQRIVSGIASSIGRRDGMTDEKVRENRLRRMAERQGLRLEKSRRRDPRAIDYGTYQLVDVYDNTLVAYGRQSGFGLSLDDIEAQLDRGRR
jgi:hypothetical protein